MPPVITSSTGKNIFLAERLGVGGEGEVWNVRESREVAKLYHPTLIKPELEQKLKTMVANPPVDEMRLQGHVSIAWPTDLLYCQGKFAGFLMPRLDRTPTIFSVYNPVRRQKECPGFNWKYLLHTAVNLSKAVDAIHLKGYVIGDLNESNVLVNARALVSIIDTDSFQVKGQNGQLYHCKVGKEDFTPPELQDVSLDKVERLPQHDYFGLGVLIFRLLMEGVYPFAGVLKQDITIDEPSQFYCLKRGAFPYRPNGIVNPPPAAPKFTILPREVQHLMVRCFVSGYQNPGARPSPRQWVQALEAAEDNLKVCKVNPEHYYAGQLPQCPWCEREASRKKASLQTPLPPAHASQVLSSRPVAVPVQPASASGASHPQSRPFIPPYTPSWTSSSIPAVQPKPISHFTLTHRSSVSMWEQVKGFFVSPRGNLGWRTWWIEVGRTLPLAMLIGIGLSFLVLLMFWYPVVAGDAFGVVVAGLLLGAVFYIARFFYNLVLPQGKGLGILVFFLGVVLAAFTFFRVAEWARAALAAGHVEAALLFLDGFLVGLIGGAAYGSFRALARAKSKVLAFATSMVIAGIPLFLIWVAGLFSLPFQH